MSEFKSPFEQVREGLLEGFVREISEFEVVGYVYALGERNALDWVENNVLGHHEIIVDGYGEREWYGFKSEQIPRDECGVTVYLYEETDLVRALLRWPKFI